MSAGEVLFGSFEMKSVRSDGGVPAPHFSIFSVGGRTVVSVEVGSLLPLMSAIYRLRSERFGFEPKLVLSGLVQGRTSF